jgi:putative flavoprotein involved in K+ transport
MTLVGLTKSYDNGTVTFAGDLAHNLARGDASHMSLLDEADAYIARNGLDLPHEPEARRLEPDPECVTNPILRLSLQEAGITSVVWATGFSADYSWLKVDAFDAQGRPRHQRGVSAEPGIYFLGLPWQSRRASSFIWGVWHDAKHLADRIDIQRNYLSYLSSSKNQPKRT